MLYCCFRHQVIKIVIRKAYSMYFIHLRKPEGKGLDISFKKKDGSWTKLVNMEKILKRNIIGGCPYVSPDGKYFFFTRKSDIYWVDAKIIEQLKAKELK